MVKHTTSLVVTIAVAGLTGAAFAHTPHTLDTAEARTVPCDEIIQDTKFPYIGSSQPHYRYRQVLGALSVPEKYLAQVVPTQNKPWTHWRKAGLVVVAGESVTATVPPAWRTRAAISWGNSGSPTSSLQIAPCPGPANGGHAYAGGFYLRTRSACLPITFAVKRRSTTIRFGIGRRC